MPYSATKREHGSNKCRASLLSWNPGTVIPNSVTYQLAEMGKSTGAPRTRWLHRSRLNSRRDLESTPPLVRSTIYNPDIGESIPDRFRLGYGRHGLDEGLNVMTNHLLATTR